MMREMSRRGFLHGSGLAAAAMWFASRDGEAGERAAPSTVLPDDGRPRLNPWRREPVDLRRFMRLGVEHIYGGCIDRRRGCLPFVRFNLTSPPTWANHEYWGSPHMVGRFLDALALCAEIIDVPHDEEAVNGLSKLLHDCLDNPHGLPFDTLPDPQGRRSGNMHHCREVLLALVGLSRWRGCERSMDLARRLVRAMERATRKTGAYPSHMLYQNGWGKLEPGWINYTTGRAVTALVTYYRASKDELAVDLARRFADDNIKRTMAPDGGLTEAAGTHLHSTEGTMAGLLYLDELTGEKRYLEAGQRLYDGELKRWRTSYGWAKESRRPSQGRGEANNTGDYIEAALVLARNGQREYFDDAERFIRNGLLAAQVVNTDWIAQSDKPDSDDEVHSDIRKRARGAFAFTMPNGYHSYNTDLIGGSLRALCQACHDAVTGGKDACRVNMRFSVESPWLAMQSSLPQAGRLKIETRRACRLFVRLPEHVAQSKVDVHIGGKQRDAKRSDGELEVGDVPPNAEVDIAFDPTRRKTQEGAPGHTKPFDIDWVADTIIAMRPTTGPIALY